MAGSKRGKAKTGKSPKKKDGQGPLAKSFATRVTGKAPPPSVPSSASSASSAAGGPAAAKPEAPLPRKLQTSGFLSYLSAASKSTSKDVSNMACCLQEKYKSLDADSKKKMVTDFFKVGGKKQGMESAYEQVAKSSQSSDDRGWAGYVTVGNLMEWSSVLSREQTI